jgi:anti-sigma regulatory factor (Ser/Thr protein kinase)
MSGSELQHFALLYGDADAFLDGTREFIEAGLAGGERVLVSVPGAKISAMRSMVNRAGEDRVEFWDMNELGRNPGRIIPAVRDWFERGDGGRSRFIGEPVWPGRSAREVAEAIRHEALINIAFADIPGTIMCPYDAARLERTALDGAKHTHPRLVHGGEDCVSRGYTDPLEIWRAREWPLPPPAPGSVSHPIGFGLAEIRDFTAGRLRGGGVDEDRVADVVLAVDEAATNALLHGRGDAELRIWREGERIICEIADRGTLDEPLAGRRRPQPDWARGRGVWLMNQLCDLVELRPTERGTVVRLHVSLNGGSDPGSRPDAGFAGVGGSYSSRTGG